MNLSNGTEVTAAVYQEQDAEEIVSLIARNFREVNVKDYGAEAMEALMQVDSVILVETAGVTLYTEIAQELELLQRQGIPLLGGIIAE